MDYRLAFGSVECLSDNEQVSRWLSPELAATAPGGKRRPVWLAGRILLAMLLEKEALPLLAAGPNGKPWHPELPHFNISNSGSSVAVLVGKDEVGCDIERLRPRTRILAVAQHSFAPDIYAWLAALPSDKQLPAFWKLWTAHEAVLKQQGGTVWQIATLGLPLATLCPPGRYLTHLAVHNTLIACCGTKPFPAQFSPELELC
ncbi:4'-phosphopantetheinyl transferase superfamily protein [Enterobacteriaceae bacterium H18W14]|uniref:4'-phosphopantetheinyl transferase superfamily protein n=1 Tax=Dryocola boscaweniae TaxID=2925397 RepID=UPI0022F1314D|nr:4'-phosphopantetheinyl transferase superfamily protein [Dryocola boscaweniae]MCT4717454.1 4'-phosphopantetheinyl transferase superfamily protein [Dryocola boscaweniae]